MRQILYFSTATDRQTDSVLDGILEISRDRNQRGSVTGLLIAGGNRYLQIIEGPEPAIAQTLDRIMEDERHVGMNIIIDRPIMERDFTMWSMAFTDYGRLGHYSTFQELADAMADRTEPHLSAQIKTFSASFASTPIRLGRPESRNERLWLN